MFKGNLTVTKYAENKWLIDEELSYDDGEVVVIIKPGFITDFASIPKYLWGIIGSPATGNYTKASVVHDGLYGSHLTPKEFADKLFLEMMKESGVSWVKRNAMYYAVKWFGDKAWNEKTENKIKKVREYVEVNYKHLSD